MTKSDRDQAPVAPASRTSYGTRLHVVLACVTAILLTGFLYTADRSIDVLRILLTDGMVALAWVVAGASSGAGILSRVVRAGVDDDEKVPPALFVTTAAGLGLGMLTLATLFLGLAGLLNRGTSLGLLAIALLAGLPSLRKLTFNLRGALAAKASWEWLWLLAMPSLGMALVGASLMPGLLWKPLDPHPYDVMSYHLQVPREWYEMGQIVPLRHNVFSFFPFGVEMHYLLLAHVMGGPWNAMYAAQFTSAIYGTLTVLAVFGAARSLTGDAASSTIGAVAVAVTPWTTMLSSVCYVEPALMLYTALAIAWITRQRRRSVLSGVMAGLACGVKLTAGPMLLASLPIAVLLSSWKRGLPVRHTIVGCIVFGALGLAVFSPWAIRNAVWTGNPVFPNAQSVFGSAHFEPGQTERYAIAHAPPADLKPVPARVTALWNQVIANWQYGFALVPLAVMGAAFQFRRRPPILMLLVVILALQIIFWIGFTHLISRFMVIAIPVLGLLLAIGAQGRLRPILVGGLVVIAATGIANVGPALRFWTVDQQLNFDGAGLFGLKDFGLLMSPQEKAVYVAGGTIYHVGDAQVFRIAAPMSQIVYRTAFDVDPSPGLSPVEAWTGKKLIDLGPNDRVLISAEEIHRVSSTYRNVPPLTEQTPGPRQGLYLLDRNGNVEIIGPN